MFDIRYHVASLAAVFLALIIGIVVGVGLSDRGLIDKGEKSLLQSENASLREDLRQARRQSASQAREQELADTFISRAYPRLIRNRLRGKRIAVIFVGPVDNRLMPNVVQALTDAGAQGPIRLRALKTPIDAAALDAALVSDGSFERYVGDGKLQSLGRVLGEEFMRGGDSPLWDTLTNELIVQRGGGSRPPDGVVVARSVPPQHGPTAKFLRGFYRGLSSSGLPAVAVDASDSERTKIEIFRRTDVSSIDDVDKPAGRLALVLLLAGAHPGHYGLKPSADDGILPPPGQLAAVGGG